MIAFDVRHYDSIGSTNDEALRLAREGAAHCTVVCAREQTAGRGRHARPWHSPVGNLYVSLVLRPDAAPDKMAELSFVTALAVADTVDRLLPDGTRAELKWPNDVLVRGAKIAGILLEYADGAVVAGIGLNIQHAPTMTPAVDTADAPATGSYVGQGAASYPTTSLVACGTALPHPDVALNVLLEAVDHRLSEWQATGFNAIRRSWLLRAHPPGTQLRVTTGARVIIGRFLDLACDGVLVIATADGPARILAGEVMVAPGPTPSVTDRPA